MLPAEFDYVRPSRLDEALHILTEYGDEGKVLAGGQSLIPLLKLRFAAPRIVIDINRIPGLDYVRIDGGYLRIGACTRQATLVHSELVQRHVPAMTAASRQVADPIIRNWGTIGGTLAHADPSGDLGSVMLAANAELEAVSTRGERTVRAREFFDGPFTTVLEADEILAEVRIPLTNGRSSGTYFKLERKVGDFATVGVAVHLDMTDGTCHEAGIGLTAVGPKNLEAREAAERLRGARLDDTVIREVARVAAEAAEPTADHRGSAEYKRDIVRVFVQRALYGAMKGDA